MALLPNEKLITTKEAGELSGYTSDYLSRLVRSGKIAGKKVGHSWLVDKESLNRFLGEQDDHKSDRARELARARAREYRVHRSVVLRAAKALTEPRSMPQQFVRMMSALPSRAALRRLRSHALALSVALLVLTFGTLGAQAEMLPRFAQNAAAVAEQTALGLEATFGDIPSHIAQRFTDVEREMRTHFSRTATTGTAASARIAPRVLRNLSVSLSFGQPEKTPSDRAAFSIRAASASKAAVPAVTAGDIRAFAADAYAVFTSPSRVTDAAANAYVSVGEKAYGAIRAALAAYRSTLDEFGARTLSAAAVARDTLRAAPEFVARTNLALGESVIAAARFVLDAEIAASYGLAAAAPASARATVALVGGTGDLLAGFTVRAAVEAPSRLARAILDASEAGAKIPEAVFSAEYAAATGFIAATNAVSGRYALALARLGEVGYESARGSRALVQSIPAEIRHPRQLQPSDLEHAGAALASAVSDAYRGALDKTSLAFDTFARTPKVAAVLNSPPMRALERAGEAGLAAALPALSAGEKAALAIYNTIHGFFTFTTDSLANLFMPPPTIVYPIAAPARPKVVTAPAPRTFNSYTTIVRGVSEDFVNQSINSLRSSLLATIADSIRPVYMQTVTNAATTQQVNMIQDLHDLIVRNGDFRNSIFDNGIRVSATDGRFTNLYGGSASLTSLTVSGATSLATTTITGDLSVSGSITPSVISAADYIRAPYFVATSTTATSTFAGSFAIDTNGFVYATSTKNVGIGVLSPAALLAIQNSTSTQPIFVASNAAGAEVYRITNAGFVGIGTTTPGYNLAVEGSSSLGNQAIAGYFTATSTTATSTFAGVLAIGTTTPFRNGLFTVGTSTPLLYIDRNSGKIGVGTSSPSVTFDIYATDAIRLPVGTTAQRPGQLGTGLIRYNTTTSQFEGYGISSWGSLGGVIDVDQDTMITAEDSAGADNDQLKFSTFGSERMRIDSNGLIGMGTTTPFANLSIAGSAGGTTNIFAISTSTSLFATTTALTIDQNGNLALLNGANLTVGGNTIHTGTLTQTGLATFTNGFLSNASSTITSGLFTMSGGASTTNITASGTASTTNLIASASVTFQNLIGMLSSNGTSGTSARTLTGTANQISIANGDGTGGNPTFSLPSTLVFTDATSTNFFAGRLTANTFSAGQTASTTIDSAGNLATAGTLQVTGQTTLATSLSGLLAGSSGVVYSTATSSLAIGSSLSNSGTLGSQIGGTASSLSLNMANANSWTALQSFLNASTTLFSSYGPAYFGATATSSFSSTGALTLITPLLVGSGGTGQNTFSSSQLLYGAGTGAVQSVATSSLAVGTGLTNSGTLGAQVGGANASISFAAIAANSLWANATGASAVPTAIATSTLGIALSDTTGTLAVARGGTGQTSFTADQIHYGNFATVATSSLAIGSSLSNSGTLGSQIGGTASSLSLNMANANSWTALQSFLNASTTLFSSYGPAYFGATATSTFDSAGNLSVGGTLTVAGLCVTGDTRLRRRRKARKGEEDEADEDGYIYDEVAIKDVKEGDEIQSLDEKTGKLVWSRVKQLAYMGKKQTYRITTEDGRSIRTTANHPYLTENGWRKVSGLKEGDRIAVSKEKKVTYAFIDAANILYRATDENGWKTDMRKLLAYLKTRYGVAEVFYYAGVDNKDAVQIGLYAAMERWGYRMRLNPIKRFINARGEPYIKADVDARLAFEAMKYAGEYDSAVFLTGDGDFYWLLEHLRRTKEVKLIASPAKTARELKKLFATDFIDLDSLNSLLAFTDKNNTTDTFDVSVAGLTSPSYAGAEEKSSVWDTDVDIVYRRIISIESIAEEDVYDIEVEGTHNFIGNDIVAHNTALFNHASSTLFSANSAYFGATATSTFSSAGALTLITPLLVASGGTGANTFSSSQLLYGAGTGAVQSVATSSLAVGTGLTNSGTLGAQVGGANASISFAAIAANSLWANATGASAVPTAIATSTLGIALSDTTGTLAVARGGTGQTSFTADQLHYGSFGTVATTTFTPSAEFTIGGTIGALVGGANSTLTLATNGIALTKLAQIAANTILGNTTGATGNVTAIATSSLGIAISDTTGTLAVARGGTGQTTFTASQLLYGAGTGAVQSVATSSIAVGTGISVTSGTLGAQVGGSAVTIGIANNALTLAQLPQIAAGFVLGNNTGATANVTSFATSTLFGTGTDGQVLAWNNGVPQFIATTSIPLAGDVGGTLSATVIGANKVTLGMLATLAANSVIGNLTGSTATPTAVATSSLFTWNGTGLVVRDTNATLTTPNLGTPSALVLTNATGLPVGGGGTGASTLTGLLQGNGASAITGITGTAGQFPYYNGASTLLATSTIFLSTSGNIGIGTAVPGYKLDVNGDVNISTGSNYKINGANLSPGSWVASGNDVYNSNSGNIGIGTTTPYSRLSVWGGGTGATAMFELTNSASTTLASVLNDGTVYMKGNVGIGTTTPQGLLHINSTTANSIVRVSTAGNGITPGLELYNSSTAYTGGRNYGIYSTDSSASAGSGKLGFYDATGGAWRMVLDSTGNVGIGTTAPQLLFQAGANTVDADFIAGVTGGIFSAGTNERLFVQGSGTAALALVDSGAVADEKHMQLITDGGITYFRSISDAAAIISDNILVLDHSTGNVGIGTTTPDSILTVARNTSANVMIRDLQANTLTDTGATLQLYGTRSTGAIGKYAEIRGWRSNSALNNKGYLSFAVSTTEGADTPTEAMRIIEGGNVGIGTTAPTGKLTIIQTDETNASTGLIVQRTTNDSRLWEGYNTGIDGWQISASYGTTGAYKPITFWTSSAERVRIDTAGNVGIGTTDPGAKLEVAGAIKLGTGGYFRGAASGYSFNNSADTLNLVEIYNSGGVGIGTTYAANGSDPGVNNLIVQGNVGIGTTGPSDVLDVRSGTNTTGLTISAPNNSGAGSQPALVFKRYSSGVLNTVARIFSGACDVGAPTCGDLQFNTGSNTSPTNVMVMTSTGNVGIGTTSPAYKLVVKGAGSTLAQFAGNAGNGAGITIGDVSGTQWILGAGMGALGNVDDFAIHDSTNNTTAVVIKSSTGNVGIGTTGPGNKLEVYGGGIKVNGLSASSVVLDLSPVDDAIIQGGTNTQIRMGGNLNLSAGNVMLFSTGGTEKLRLQSSGGLSLGSGYVGTDAGAGSMIIQGNVGIGTTSPGTKFAINSADNTSATNIGTFYANNGSLGVGIGYETIRQIGPGNQKLFIDANGSGNLLLQTTSTGNVGIGTTAPGGALHVVGPNGNQIRMSTGDANYYMMGRNATDGNFNIFGSQFGSNILSLTTGGNVGIGTTSPATLLEVGGSTANVTFDGYKSCTGFTSDGNGKLACTASDQRLKNNIQAMSASSSLAALRSLAPVSFYWRDASPSGLEQYGFIAQDVVNVFPNLVQTTNPTELTPGGTMTVNYIGLIAPMIGAIQALDAKLGPLAGVLSVVPGVESQCVTGDTRLRRRRKRVDGSFEFDEIEIKNVVVGDEVQSLDEATGSVVYSRVNALLDMGTQEVFELVTKSGRRIRTTSNHPFLARIRTSDVQVSGGHRMS